MEWWCWLVVGLVLILAIWLTWYFLVLRTKSKSASTSGASQKDMPEVCSVWDRWVSVKERGMGAFEAPADSVLLGTAWIANQCPVGALYQRVNRKEIACIRPEDRADATQLICSRRISNDEIARPLAAVFPENTNGCCDHWVQLKQGIEFEAGTKMGNAWIGNTCPEGAALQLLDNNEIWCMPVQDIASMPQE